MAKAKLLLPMNFRLGDYSIYPMKGVDNLVVRTIADINKIKRQTAPQFERLRINQVEFGAAGKLGSHLVRAVYAVKSFADYPYTGQLTKLCKFILKEDAVNLPGKRSVIISNNLDVFRGFKITKTASQLDYLLIDIGYEFNRDEFTGIVHFPRLFPQLKMLKSDAFTLRFTIGLGVVQDFVYSEFGYKAATVNTKFDPAMLITEWYSTNATIPSGSFSISLDPSTRIDHSCTMILSIGVEYGRMDRGQIYPMKEGKSARILGLG